MLPYRDPLFVSSIDGLEQFSVEGWVGSNVQWCGRVECRSTTVQGETIFSSLRSPTVFVPSVGIPRRDVSDVVFGVCTLESVSRAVPSASSRVTPVGISRPNSSSFPRVQRGTPPVAVKKGPENNECHCKIENSVDGY